MWISNEYYEELLDIIKQFSKGSFDFDEEALKKFEGARYKKLTNALVNAKLNAKKQVDEITELLDSLIQGNYQPVDARQIPSSKYEIFYSKYNELTAYFDRISARIERVQKIISQQGKIDTRIDVDEFSGKWFDTIGSINAMLESLSTPIDEITTVINNVARGNLSQKMRLEIDGFKISGEFLHLATTINIMVDQLAQFASEVTRVAKEVGTDGLLGGQARVEGVSGTWLDLTNNVNAMADSLTAQVRNIADVTTAVANGDLSQKITVDAKGEILELKGTINVMVDQLAQFASEVTRVAKEVGTDGLLGGQARVEGVSGTWLDLTNNVNAMADSLTAQVRNIADVTTAVANGDLSQKITVDAKGEILELKGTINVMVDQLAQFASEVTRVAKEVGTDGLLGGQARVEGVSGTWLDLTNSVNAMADSLTAQVRNIADVTTAVANGDLSQKITVDAKGEILELKGTINTMVGQLAQFASEVSRVAKEVGTDGLLGGQARVEGVSGTWLDLTNNVNAMAESLTVQVRNIIEVAVAVAKGDLTRQIDIDAKGELRELKNNMNAMIHVLADSDTKTREQNWIKDGVSLINREVLDKDSFAEQLETSVTFLARYVNAGMGALYIYDKQKEILTLEASYAYVKRANLSNEFKMGEGVVGQVAYEKKPILLTNVVDSTRITTGTTECKPLNTYTAPLIFKDELIGVIELASYEAFHDLHLEYFHSALSVLSGSLYASLQSSSTKKLLTQSQAQSEELQEQSFQLKHQNEELEEQRVELARQKIELEKKNKDLESAQVEISRAKELELANKYKSEFLANMSHELRTPLNSILLLSHSLATTKKTDLKKINEQASVIYDAGNGLLELINDVLDLSKIEANLMNLNVEDVTTRALTDELYQLFIPQAENKNMELKVVIRESALETFFTDKIKLTQILKNFLSNAIKFTDENGKIAITAEKNDEEDADQRPVKISVSDNGIGIEKDKIDLIFEAFRQADGSTSRKYGGTGLGLSISKEFANLLGGRIGVTSEIGVGSTFSVYLPLKLDTRGMNSQLVEHVKEDEEEKENKPSKTTVIQEQIRTESKNLSGSVKSVLQEEIKSDDAVCLVVDDDEMFARIMKDKIASLGYQVVVAHDGSTAVSLAREYQPKAILLDMVLPGLNGIDVLRVLKADFATRHIPVKVISFNSINKDIKQLGAVDFLKKPISENILDEAISSLIAFADSEKRYLLTIQDTGKELVDLLSDKNVKVFTENNAENALKKLEEDGRMNALVIDANLIGMDIPGFLDMMKEKGFHLPVVIYDRNNVLHTAVRNYEGNIILKVARDYGKLVEYVSLFLHTEKISMDNNKQKLLNESMMQDSLLYHKKVLMIDDDVINIFALSSVLEEKNIEVTTAENGKEALEILKNSEADFDLLLVDIMMPVMDGYETMQEIRKIDRFKNLPIIACTAKVQKEDKQKCLDAGANDYMAKPIDNEKLLYLLKIWTKEADFE